MPPRNGAGMMGFFKKLGIALGKTILTVIAVVAAISAIVGLGMLFAWADETTQGRIGGIILILMILGWGIINYWPHEAQETEEEQEWKP